MQLVQNLLGTSVIQSIMNLVVFFLILGITLHFVMKTAGMENGAFALKNLTDLKKNFSSALPAFLKSLLITIFIFVIMGIGGFLTLMGAFATIFGKWIQAILEWFVQQAGS